MSPPEYIYPALPVSVICHAADLRARVAAGESKVALAREFGISRETVYGYLKPE